MPDSSGEISDRNTSIEGQRLLDSGVEAGTAPGDRRYRPDVEGLRAVAVLLVVLFHYGVPRLTGGFVGVDVFFVISGFVITGLLLREHEETGRTSILGFYARRSRRILPAATLVILVTVFATYVLVGTTSGFNTADDGRWAAAFVANFHFEAVGANPLSSLGNFWSLSVEEQFYVIYPTVFLLAAKAKGALTFRQRLAVALGVVVVTSYWLSIVHTASAPRIAYLSPFTRAWELALGALITIGTTWLKKIPKHLAAVSTWAGLIAILSAAFAFNLKTPYPGSLVAVPVIGAALIIAGGVAVPKGGVESVLGLQPCSWLGKRSYSLYLWHWPILVLAAETPGGSVGPWRVRLLLGVLAFVVSVATYQLFENPIRHWRLQPRLAVGFGLGLVIAVVMVLSLLMLVKP